MGGVESGGALVVLVRVRIGVLGIPESSGDARMELLVLGAERERWICAELEMFDQLVLLY